MEPQSARHLRRRVPFIFFLILCAGIVIAQDGPLWRGSQSAAIIDGAESDQGPSDPLQHEHVVGDRYAEAIITQIATEQPQQPIEVFGKTTIENPITGHKYTVLKLRLEKEDVVASMNQSTGAFSLEPHSAEKEAAALLRTLPTVYRKMDGDLLRTVRHVQGGFLGAQAGLETVLDVTLYSNSPQGLDAIQAALPGVAMNRLDGPALYSANPPIFRPDDQGIVMRPPPAPQIFAIEASLSLRDILRVGALPAVISIEPTLLFTHRLDVSTPRINGDDVRNFIFVEGLTADVGIVDSGVDSSNPNLPYVIAEATFIANPVCDAGGRVGLRCDCPGGACNAGTGVCNGGTRNALNCTCPGGGTCRAANANICDGGSRAGLPCDCPGAGGVCMAGACMGGTLPGAACGCPNGTCEDPPSDTGDVTTGDPGGHGTNVAGIAGSNQATFRGMGPYADLINAKAIPGNDPQIAMALAFAQGAGADVINGSYGGTGAGCIQRLCSAPAANRGNPCTTSASCDSAAGAGDGRCSNPRVCAAPPGCTAPAASVGRACFANVHCDSAAGAGDGICGGSTLFSCLQHSDCDSAPGAGDGFCSTVHPTPNFRIPCITNADCDVPAGAGNGLCNSPTPNGQSQAARDVDFHVYTNNITIAIAAEERPYNGRCSNNNAIPCANNVPCGAGTCVAFPSTPNDAFNVITVGSSNLSGPPSAWSTFSQIGPASNNRSKPDVLAPGEAPGNDAIDSTAHVWEGGANPDIADGACAAPAAVVGRPCNVNADCGAGGFCGPFEGTSMASPHVAGLAAVLWDWGNRFGRLNDSPYLKSAIINNCNRLAGVAPCPLVWTHTPIQPLDICQGAGEVDALATWKAYTDDLRVWQQRVTGTDEASSHWYWIDVTGSSDPNTRVVVTLVFERHVTVQGSGNKMCVGGANNGMPCSDCETSIDCPGGACNCGTAPALNDLDLRLYDPDCNQVDSSISSVDSVEHIVYDPPADGRYCIEVDPFNLATDGVELYAVACNYPLHFLGNTKPCVPDFGDAPDPFTAPGNYPTLLANNGARHFDWTKEWLGTSRPEIDGELRKTDLAVVSRVDPFPSVSGEKDANDPNDQDGVINLTDQDRWDDGVVIHGPLIPLKPTFIDVTVECTVDETGVGPMGRYESNVPTKRLYLNAWADWNGDGDWKDAGEKIIGTGSPTGRVAIDPETFGPNGMFTIGESFTDSNASGMWEPPEPWVEKFGFTRRKFRYKVTPPRNIAPHFYCRFRLDYGEDVGLIANLSGNLAQEVGRAQFGEVEDYSHHTPDPWTTWRDGVTPNLTFQDFSQDPIPADFFGPGSEPFTGTIEFEGVPLDHVHLGDADTLVMRSCNPASQADPVGTVGTVDIQILALSLVSVDPITVTYSGTFCTNTGEACAGDSDCSNAASCDPKPDELWDVRVGLSTADQQRGSLTATKTHANGGVFDSTLPVLPRLTFQRQNEPAVAVLDLGESGSAPIIFDATDVPYVHKPIPTLGIVTQPGSTFIPGVLEDTGSGTQTVVITTEEAQLARHTVCPPRIPPEFDFFPVSRAEVTIDSPLGTETVTLIGPTNVVVDLPGLGDNDGDGLEEVPTEMVQLELVGEGDIHGPITVRLRPSSASPFQPTVGEIEEELNNTPGELDLPPFTETGSAISTFDVFFEVDVGGALLHNETPKHMETRITRKPPDDGETYQSPELIPLFQEDNTFSGVFIGPASHTPRPLATPCGQCPKGTHWIDGCPPGNVTASQDSFDSGALVGLDINGDCQVDTNLVLHGPVTIRTTGPFDDSEQFPGSSLVDGHLDVIDTEIVQMELSGGGMILTGGAGGGVTGLLQPSKGAIVENVDDPALGESFFEVRFELVGAGLPPVYNHQPVRVEATINCVPPDDTYFHIDPCDCLPLFDSPIAGEGQHLANLVVAQHEPFPGCGSPTTGACQSAHDTPYCNDAACCANVCGIDPTCCSDAWSESCVSLTKSACFGASTGACCHHDLGFCTDNVTPAQCNLASDEFFENASCFDLFSGGLCTSSATGACCGFDGKAVVCVETDQFSCQLSFGGVYQGPNTSCTNGCPAGFLCCDLGQCRNCHPGATPDPNCQFPFQTCLSQPQCGNGIVESGEQCDGSDSFCPDGFCQPDCTCGGIQPAFFGVSTQACCLPAGECADLLTASACSCQGGLLAGSCEECASQCGNNVREPGEECDGTDNAACAGTVAVCSDSCTCPTLCGNNVVDQGEECDGTDNTVCPEQCQADCRCAPECGDGILDPGEECDGSADAACPGNCTPDCGCAVCGDGVAEAAEGCDGSDDGSCPTLCDGNCTCPTPVCGNNIVEAGEHCDGTSDLACVGNCLDDCQCRGAPTAMSPLPPSKVRYLSAVIPSAVTAGPGSPTAIEVELVSMPRFRCSNDNTKGCNVDANCGAGNTCIEIAPFPGEGGLRYVQLVGVVEDSEVLGTTFVAGVLSCDPDYQDWEAATAMHGGELHIAGAEIVPKGEYNLRRLAASCTGNEAGCTAKSEALVVTQAGWGDVNGDNALNVSDISNEVDVLKGLPSGHLAKYRAQVQPNAPDPTLKPSVQDLANVVDPNKGIGYPFPGPCDCPSSIACSPTTSCSSTADCPAPRRCVSGQCSLVDNCGRCLP